MRTDSSEVQELDVRAVEGEPFGDIMSALNRLEDGETLRLINSFEPVPLYDVLDERGFDHESRQVDDGVWYIEISRA